MNEINYNNTYAKSFKEVFEILKTIPKYEYEQIPQEEIDFFEKNMDKNYEYIFNQKNPKTLRKTDSIIIYLYANYIADDNERDEINNILKQNAVKNEEKKKLKYPVDVFNKTNKLLDTSNIYKYNFEETALTEINESFFKNIIKNIKKFLNIK